MVLAVALAATLAQPLQHDAESWLFLSTSGRQAKARWYLEAQPRFSFTKAAAERLVLRAAAGVQLTDAVSLWASFVWTHGFASAAVNEQRPTQQLLVEHRFGALTLANRTRLEERFFEALPMPAYRVRHQARLTFRLTPSLALFVADELFVHLNGVLGGPRAGFEQHRATIGLNARLGALSLELAYLNLFVDRPSGSPDRMSHDLILSISALVPEQPATRVR